MHVSYGSSLICAAVAASLVAVLLPRWRNPDQQASHLQMTAIVVLWEAGVLIIARAIPSISPKPLPPGWQPRLIIAGIVVTIIATGFYVAEIRASRQRFGMADPSEWR